jgi:fluoride exporter
MAVSRASGFPSARRPGYRAIMSFLQPYLLVFVGAGLGGMLRHGFNVAILRLMGPQFPWATYFINVTGSIVMGLLVGLLALRDQAEWTQNVRLLLATGVLGGYTTFSTFSLDTILLVERGETGAALAYVGGSVLLGVLGLWGGLSLVRAFT